MWPSAATCCCCNPVSSWCFCHFWSFFCCYIPGMTGIPSVLALMLLLAFICCWDHAVVDIWVLILVFPHCCRLLYCGVPAVYGMCAAIGFSAVAGVLLLLTSLLLLVFYYCCWCLFCCWRPCSGKRSFMLLCDILQICRHLRWYRWQICYRYQRHRLQIYQLCAGSAPWLPNISANFRKNLKRS